MPAALGLPLPAYGSASLGDLLPSVLAALGVPGEPDVLGLPPLQRCVVLLVDGLGLELLRRHPAQAPFLSALAQQELTCGFPSTTAVSLTSLGTGLPPAVHGVTGYTSWVEEVGDTVAWLTWTGSAGRTDLREVLVPEVVQPHPTVFERAARDGVEVTVAAPAAFAGSGLTRAALRGGHYRGSVSPGDAVAEVVAGSRRGTRSLAYAYTPDLDLTGHVRGTASEAWTAQLALVDGFAEELAGRLPAGTTLLVTADHGMVDVGEADRVDLDALPHLLASVRAVAGEPRARHVHCLPGAAADVRDAWRAELGDRAWVGLGSDALAAGLLGAPVSAAARARTGDVVAVATGRTALVRTAAEPAVSRLVGHHGALTPDELRVPLLST